MGAVEYVDAVVVGSGFGASVSAYRLAEAGRSVVVLERGRAYPPGSFARNPYEMSRAFWEPKDELLGLFDIRSFRKLEAIVSSGLGGGSLIYANVLLRKDEKWFVHDSPLPGGGYENWPIGRHELDRHYDAVEAMMTPAPNPYPDLPKAQALREVAEKLGLEAFSPPLAISFSVRPGAEALQKQIVETPEYGNIHGVTRLTCRLCGECDIGCNEGAKNTLDHNYLSAAARYGADLRTLCDVDGITPLDGGGYEVRYVRYGEMLADGRYERTREVIRCGQLFLGAGTFGTTSLLLRNRVALPAIGRALGTRFSGNGDLITFCLGAESTTESGATRILDPAYGPVITTAIRQPDGLDGEGQGRGYYVQEAGFPEFTNWLVETAQITSSMRRAASVVSQIVAHRLANRNESTISGEVAKLVGQGRLTSSSLPLLGMGRDTPDGRIKLTDGELDVEWTTATSKAYFDAMRTTMQQITQSLGGRFRDNPLWWTKRVVTVHPLGGSPMGRAVHDGVVDSWGESFGHPGLFVVDGAAVPGPVGPNPSLTIAAMADRVVEHVLENPKPVPARTQRTPSRAAPAASAAPADPVAGRGMEFTEQMKGYLALDETDPVAGWEIGRQLTQRFMFQLTITAPDVDRFVAGDDHTAVAEGYVDCDVLGGRLPVQRGWANLFVAAGAHREMRYRLWFSDLSGEPVTMYGFKTVRDDKGFDMWTDTSTLYITLLRGHVPPGAEGAQDADADVFGAGVLRILPLDFARQLTTFRGSGGGPLASIAKFGTFFAMSMKDAYLRPKPAASAAAPKEPS
ncbi:GMC oxidoreductase [Microbacterium cremeum]|uniref:GMC oxidoreductase n=1 Tax=Microbacterium cremeum TaxID=2782169 RepID=UPI0018885FD3|nr:GMC family oxidoreductase [Microbacterium cremeum]